MSTKLCTWVSGNVILKGQRAPRRKRGEKVHANHIRKICFPSAVLCRLSMLPSAARPFDFHAKNSETQVLCKLHITYHNFSKKCSPLEILKKSSGLLKAGFMFRRKKEVSAIRQYPLRKHYNIRQINRKIKNAMQEVVWVHGIFWLPPYGSLFLFLYFLFKISRI